MLPDSPVSRGFAAVKAVVAQPRYERLRLLWRGQKILDEVHREGILAEIAHYLENPSGPAEEWASTARDLARFVRILEIVSAGVVIQVASDDTPAERFYGGFV